MTTPNQRLNPSSWVEAYADMLFSFTVARVQDEETAKDLVQETFLSALKAKENFRGEVSEKNWLFTILKNKIIDHYRKKAKSLVSSLNESLREVNDFFDDNGKWNPVFAPQPWSVGHDRNIEEKEFFEVLDKCRKKLSELQNLVFTMKYLDEKKSEEICKELELSSSNYWVLVHRAKLQLRRCLEKNWFTHETESLSK